MSNNESKELYSHICPVCLEQYPKPILQDDGMWHCRYCGVLYYSPEYRKEIDDLLSVALHRKIFLSFVRKQNQMRGSEIDISPQIIKKVLKENGVLK